MSERFYVADSLQPGPHTIMGPEAHHMAQVLRLKAGQAVVLFNGDGHEYPARLESVHKNLVELEVLAVRAVNRERSRNITLASPLPKGDRAAFLIEKLTELGVARYIPLRTDRSVVHPGEGKMEKLERYVIEASKQCGRNVLMTIEPMVSWPELVQSPSLPAMRFMTDGSGTQFLASGQLLSRGSSLPGDGKEPCILAVGPEGGWTSEELNLARQQAWQVTSLGPAILRMETAAIAAAVLAA